MPLKRPNLTRDLLKPNGALATHLKLPIVAEMYAPREGTLVRYMRFTSSLVGWVELTFTANGKLLMKGAEELPLKINQSWSQEYVRKYNPNLFLNWEAINDSIRKGFIAEGIEIPLPKFQTANKAKTMRASGGKFLPNVVRLNFEFEN